jgi:hypothetical protein
MAAMMRAFQPGVVIWRVVAAACCALLGCATPSGERPPQSPTVVSQPEPDPACWGTVRERLLVHGIQQVTAEVTVDGQGEVKLVRFLSPGLTPAAEQDLRSACERCPWRPGITGQGTTAATSTRTLTIQGADLRR